MSFNRTLNHNPLQNNSMSGRYPLGNGPSINVPVVITGTGFGLGPNVVLFDSFSGGNAGEVIDHNAAEVGNWDRDNTWSFATVAGPEYYEYNNRQWMTTRKLSELQVNVVNTTGLEWRGLSAFDEFRLCYRSVLPLGRKYTGTVLPNTKDNVASNWKPIWLGRVDSGRAAQATGGQPDMIVPTINPNFNSYVTGNNVRPKWNDGSDHNPYLSFSTQDEDLHMYYQKPETTDLGTDGILDWGSARANGTFNRTVNNTSTIFRDDPQPVLTKSFDMFLFNGWMGNGSSQGYDNVLPLMTDAYLAVGENSRACIITSNAPTIDGSTAWYIVPPDKIQGVSQWSDTEIQYTPRSYENLGHTHLILADGTLLENV